MQPKRCTTIQSGRRVGNAYVMDTWGRGLSKEEKAKRKASRSRIRPTSDIVLQNYDPPLVPLEQYPDYEEEWEPEYQEGYAGMGAGSYERLLKHEAFGINIR